MDPARVPGLWRFRGFERADWWLLLRAFRVLPLRVLQLRLRGYGSTARSGAIAEPRRRYVRTRTASSLQLARRTEWLVGLASRFGICRGNCLSQSLTLIDLLGAQGISGELCIGVQKPSPALQAHAWVEHEGVVLNDTSDIADRFAPIAGVWPRA